MTDLVRTSRPKTPDQPSLFLSLHYVELGRDEPVPADMILLSTSNEDGVAYVDTAQLDGETSLKPKFALEETMCW